MGGIIGDLTLIGNHVKGNLQEGIYIINTNATDQSAVPPIRRCFPGWYI